MANARVGITLVRKDKLLRREIVHNEALCLMRYQNKVTGRLEWLWNSRDGVTPFLISDPMCTEEEREAYLADPERGSKPDPTMMAHVDWWEDTFVPNFVPPIGMRIFMSWRDAPGPFRDEMLERWKLRIADAPPEQKEQLLAGEPFGMQPDGPISITVEETLHQRFHDLARDNPFVPPEKAGGIIVPGATGLRPQ